MQSRLLFPVISTLLLTMIPLSGTPIPTVLLSGGGFPAGTTNGVGSGNLGNNTQDIAFTTPLPVGKTSLAQLAPGEILSISFDMAFTSVTNTETTHLSVGFMSGTAGTTTGNSVFYSLIRPNETGGAPASGFRSRAGSVFASTLGTTLGTGIDTTFIYFDTVAPEPILQYAVTLSATKINATDVEMFLQIGDHEFTEIVSWPAERTDTFNADITRLGFRNNAGNSFQGLAVSNVEVLMIPEPSTVAALIGAVAGLAVILRRRKHT